MAKPKPDFIKDFNKEAPVRNSFPYIGTPNYGQQSINKVPARRQTVSNATLSVHISKIIIRLHKYYKPLPASDWKIFLEKSNLEEITVLLCSVIEPWTSHRNNVHT